MNYQDSVRSEMFEKSLVMSALLLSLIPGCSGLAEPQRANRVPPKTQQQASNQTPFKLLVLGEAQDDNGTRLALTLYQAADGTKLSAIHKEFESQLKAQQYFETALAKAQRVAVRDEKKNHAGVVVGKRAEAIFERALANGTDPAVLWTDGPHFHEIISTSSSMNIELEKQMTP